MKKYQYLISPQISKIESNREYIPYFSFGDWLKESHQSVPANIEISFNIAKDLSRSPSLIQKFQSCYASDFGDEIYYERKLGLRMRGKMHLKNILKDAEILTNSAYFKYVRIKMDNVYPPGVHLADVL